MSFTILNTSHWIFVPSIFTPEGKKMFVMTIPIVREKKKIDKNVRNIQKLRVFCHFLTLSAIFSKKYYFDFFDFFGKPLKTCILYSTFWPFLKGVSKSGRKCQKVTERVLNTIHWMIKSHWMLQSHRITDSHRISENS